MTAATRHPFERELMIRFSHCDPAGIVFFPQYLVMLNNLVEDWFTEGLGIAYAGLLGPRRIGLPTVSLSCEFTAPSRMGETVALGLTIERIGGASITLQLGCRLGDQARMSARQVLVATSLETHRAIPLPDDVRTALEHFRRMHPTENSGDPR
ncbi:acyl-CoA thioesterase [Schlegelella sp. S2-27]|uniref:Acyl-CoA thioesterase n=1 Tax=Caldimonas mangrovi TaxID=2944811 RepID=A0ABT0YN44_9BURK|nr:thioesterase family protein [Caldimonas mangrovi]MCM5679859.1 acyl-CoA thioesterase [Caldimonas mangrovi]